MSKTVVVFGVSGQIGASVAKSLSRYFKVRGISRDPSSPKCQALSSQGIEIIQADQTNQQSMDNALRGAYGCFVMTNSNFADPCGEQHEKQQGMIIAKACQRNNIQHVVYSTQMSVVKSIGMRAQHMDAKAEIEMEMKEMGLPVTGIIVPLMYESLLEPPFRPYRFDSDYYGVDLPVGQCSLYMISAEDIGPIVLNVLQNRQRWLNKTMSVCGDKRTVPEIAGILSNYCNRFVFRDAQVTLDQWEQHHQFQGVQDFKNMFGFYTRVDQRASLDLTAKMYSELLSFEDWVAGHTDIIEKALSYPDSPAGDPWACM